MQDAVVAVDYGTTRVITMNRPAVRNAMNREMALQMHALLAATGNEPEVTSVILTGAGGSFSAGLDVKELRGDGGELLRTVTTPESNPFRALRALPQPVIAAVDGPAFTGGLELVLGCDIVVASTRATFADTHAKVGVMPAQGVASLLSAAVGVPLAKWMSFTGNPIASDRAVDAGLVVAVVEPDGVLREAQRVAADLAAADQPTLRAEKALYEQGLKGTRAEWDALERSMFSEWLTCPVGSHQRGVGFLTPQSTSRYRYERTLVCSNWEALPA